jgi:putative membrane protein
MAFIDDLALIEVLLLLVATVLAYAGVRVWWAMRSHQPESLRRMLKSTAVPVGAVGLITLGVAVWGEIAWPFPAALNMAGYNIFFFDPLLLCGLVLVAYGISAYMTLRLQYVGVFALVAGGVTVFYGWTGYTASPAFTKDPFDTLLLYAGFGVAGILAFPATVIVDWYLSAVDAGRHPWKLAKSTTVARVRGLGVRAAQPVAPAGGSATSTTDLVTELKYRMPKIAQAVLLLFPVFIALAAIAAFWYFGTTLPGHLGKGPGAAP